MTKLLTNAMLASLVFALCQVSLANDDEIEPHYKAVSVILTKYEMKMDLLSEWWSPIHNPREIVRRCKELQEQGFEDQWWIYDTSEEVDYTHDMYNHRRYTTVLGYFISTFDDCTDLREHIIYQRVDKAMGPYSPYEYLYHSEEPFSVLMESVE